MSEKVLTVGGNKATRPLSEFARNIAGTIFYVGPNATGIGDDERSGRSKETSLLTLAKALTLVTASKGDIIYLLPGHAETVTAAIDINKIGVRIIGLGTGKLRPAFTCNAAIDCMTVTVADVLIQNIYFLASTLASVTARINVAAANCEIRNCLFLCGAHDAETITVADAGDDLLIEGCEWRITANGPTAAIEIEANGVDGLQVKNCHFNGGSDTNGWDTGAINSGVTHTNCLIKDNTFIFGPAIIFSSTAKGLIIGNAMGEGTLGSMLDPGSCMCVQNYETDAIDESGSLFPQATPVGGGIATDVAAILADTGTNGVVLGADAITAAKIGDNALSEEHFDGDAVQAVTMGKKVSKVTAVLAGTSTVDLFTVATGRVIVHAIVGEVTIIVETQATSCKLISTPTTGTAADLCAALDLTADEVGCLYGITGLTGDALVGTNAGATICPKHGVVVPIGVIGFNNASAANTGSVKWDIYYTPLDTGAVITSA